MLRSARSGFARVLTEVRVHRAFIGLNEPDQVTVPFSYVETRAGSSVEFRALLVGLASTDIALLIPDSASAYATWSAFERFAPRPASDEYWITVTNMNEVASRIPSVRIEGDPSLVGEATPHHADLFALRRTTSPSSVYVPRPEFGYGLTGKLIASLGRCWLVVW